MAIAAASIGAFVGAPALAPSAFVLAQSMFSPWAGGRRRRARGWLTKNEFARKHGVPKAFRQYAKRYGSSVQNLVQLHLQMPA